MLGERLIVKSNHKVLAEKLSAIMYKRISPVPGKYVITMAGESGAGKSGIAHELTRILNERGVVTALLQQDDYFLYPPGTNHKRREEDISRVGMGEVNLEALQNHIDMFRRSDTNEIIKPLVVFDENIIREEIVPCRNVKVLMIEGTYVTTLNNVDCKIFLTKTYRETEQARLFRKRDRDDNVIRRSLEIEHEIISSHRDLADIVIEKNYYIDEKE